MDLAYFTGLAAMAVLFVEQALKMIPTSFTDLANKYPVATNIILSIIASIVVTPVVWTVGNWKQVIVNVGAIALVAALGYTQLVKKSALKNLETTVPESK